MGDFLETRNEGDSEKNEDKKKLECRKKNKKKEKDVLTQKERK